jgi:hypothetical protein
MFYRDLEQKLATNCGRRTWKLQPSDEDRRWQQRTSRSLARGCRRRAWPTAPTWPTKLNLTTLRSSVGRPVVVVAIYSAALATACSEVNRSGPWLHGYPVEIYSSQELLAVVALYHSLRQTFGKFAVVVLSHH